MSLSETQILGLSENTHELYVEIRPALKAAGHDVDEMLRIHQQLHDEAVALNAKQEALKRELKETTIKVRKCMRKLYNLSSGYVDTAMTAVERGSPAAKIIRRLRSRIRRPDVDESPTVQPAPVKTQ